MLILIMLSVISLIVVFCCDSECFDTDWNTFYSFKWDDNLLSETIFNSKTTIV